MHLPLSTKGYVAQANDLVCWDACARMMWYCKHKSFTGYAARAGSYARHKKGLSPSQMDILAKRLGMHTVKSGSNTKSAQELRTLLRNSSPIQVALRIRRGSVNGHMVLVINYKPGLYTLVNPWCGLVTGKPSNPIKVCKETLFDRSLHRDLGQYLWYWK